ncbi:MAG: MBL fold metallo-hydrolase RNA specificity domain-containing protein, partial [Halobacteriota archaeon]|nr:MBL fold metallo-hydrolase RNA specificity domain-containing protein [Halobacteriota archaeon]
ESDKKLIRILYTGDIRFHGGLGTTIDQYVKDVGEGIDVMICEGTRIDSESRLTEKEVKEKIKQEIQNTKSLAFVDFSWKDTTRYETIREASEESNRIFIINSRLAYLLNKLGNEKLPPSVKVFLKRKSSCLYSPADYSKDKHEYGYSTDWENDKDSSHYTQGITAEEVKRQPEKYVLMMSYFDLNQLFDLADKNGKLPGSRFIKAVCEPFCDEMELDEERLINWLDTFEIKFTEGEPEIPSECTYNNCTKIKKRIERAHVSGHASKPELIELITKLKPKKVIPVHTEHPEVFEGELRDTNIEVIVPESGKSIEIG